MRFALAVALSGCADPRVVYTADEAWPEPRAGAFDEAALVVVDSAEDTLAVLGALPLRELGRVPIGIDPVEMEGAQEAAWARGRLLVTVAEDPQTEDATGPHTSHLSKAAPEGYALAVGRDGALLGSERVDPRPSDVLVTLDGRVLVSHYDISRAIRVLHDELPREDADTTLEILDEDSLDAVAHVPVCPAPSGVAVSTDGAEAYLACYGSDEVSIVDLSGEPQEVVRLAAGTDPRFAHPYYSPRSVAVSPVDGRVWVSCWMEEAGSGAPGELRVFDPVARTMDGAPGPLLADPDDPTSGLLGNPMQGVFDEAGSRLFVPFRVVDQVAIVDPGTGALLRSRAFTPDECLRAAAATLSPDESILYVMCEGDHVGPGKVLALDAETLETTEEVLVGVWATDLEAVQ